LGLNALDLLGDSTSGLNTWRCEGPSEGLIQPNLGEPSGDLIRPGVDGVQVHTLS
jgi:hypothetical protein